MRQNCSDTQLTNSAPLIEDGDSSADEIPYKDATKNRADATDDDSADDDEGDAEPDECVISTRRDEHH